MYSKDEIDKIRSLEMSTKLSDQWEMYLRLIRAEGRNYPTEVMREMKRAFYAACGQMLFLAHDVIADMEEGQAVETLESMMAEVKGYWSDEAGIFDKEQNN